MANPLLGPVVALVAWTLVMLVWLAAVRGKAVRKARINIMASKGGRGQNLEGVLPDEANWPAHNYAHLMEQPTLFYAIVLTLVAMGDTIAINLWLAWGYVVLRVLHSIVQTTINRVAIRFPIFALSTLCLVGLTVHAGARLLHG
ncbi:MAPEG family protein [Sphingomonas sp. LY160]|uniref:MAPEG family protein n=1 Tax=Sphingomonas sp. LY160 TaxID=3095342 RepID=UPI002ADEFC5B|nr:MAPEG family protein [Sphingomonas sp. LY160]MEA1071179.1 MAPEG family protein [Sphingomonas sp. LY160]